MKKTMTRYLLAGLAIAFFFYLNTAAADEAAAFAVFDEMNSIDIETARLALKKGNAELVKSLAQMIVDDHEPIREKARRIAETSGLKPAVAGSGEPAVLARLKEQTGAAFDKAYIDHELPFSKNFIAKLREEIIPAITSAELKTYLQSLVPKFEEHLMHIEHSAMRLQMGSHEMVMEHK